MHIILILLYLFSSLNGAVYFTYLWQLKEYRCDRMTDGMRTRSGLHKVFPNFQIIKIILLAAGVLHFAFVKSAEVFYFYAITAFGIEFLEFLTRIFLKRIFRPKKTTKALLIVVLTFCLMVTFGAIGVLIATGELYGVLDGNLSGGAGFVLLALSVLVADLNSIVVLAFNPITAHMKKKVILRARRKLAAMSNLKVIGITGSYGKSSTKEFLYDILQSHFPGKVFKTPGNTNVDIGVAQEILTHTARSLPCEINGRSQPYEFAIIEMGAYKKGEIKAICDLVRPSIGVVTAVSDQHLALFGSLQNIREAKYELVESLPESGIGFFNADDSGALELAERAKNEKRKVITYACGAHAKIMALHVKVSGKEIDFDVHGIKFNAKVFGRQNLPNLLAAIAVAHECGMTFGEISRAMKNLKMPDKIMNLKESATYGADLLIIDDSYNANPEGVRAALDYLKNFKGYQKILVFPGMLELGQRADAQHISVGEKIKEICDFTVFTSADFLKPLMIGLGGNYDQKKYAVSDSAERTYEMIKRYLQGRKAVILFESRGSESVMKEFLL